MKRTTVLILVVALNVSSFLSCANSKSQKQAVGSANVVRLLDGDYLSAAYIDELKKTRSPLQAGKVGSVELLEVRHDGTKFVLQPINNFHEGDSEITVNEEGSAVAPAQPNGQNISVNVTVIDDHTIRLGYGELKPTTYVYVKSAAAYVAQAVLVGGYTDGQGRSYKLKQDGWAVFPDRRFEFEIGLDHVLNDYDYFMDAGSDKNRLPWTVWAFRWKADTLQVFRTKSVDGGPEEISDMRPYLILHRVR